MSAHPVKGGQGGRAAEARRLQRRAGKRAGRVRTIDQEQAPVHDGGAPAIRCEAAAELRRARRNQMELAAAGGDASHRRIGQGMQEADTRAGAQAVAHGVARPAFHPATDADEVAEINRVHGVHAPRYGILAIDPAVRRGHRHRRGACRPECGQQPKRPPHHRSTVSRVARICSFAMRDRASSHWRKASA